MYLFTLALLVTSAAAAADLFQRWDYSAMEPNPPNPLQKRQLVQCAASVNGDKSCAATCGPGYASCVGMNPPICYNKSNGESCCGNGVLCFTGFYCDPKGCCPNGVLSKDCVVNIKGPATVISSAAGSRATGSSSTTGSKGSAGSKKNVNNEGLGLVLGGLGILFTL